MNANFEMDPCCHNEDERCQVEKYDYWGSSDSLCLDLIGDNCQDHSKLPRFCRRDGSTPRDGHADKFICCDGEEIDAEGVNTGLSKCSRSEDDRVDLLSCPQYSNPTLKLTMPMFIISAIVILLIFLYVCRRHYRSRNSLNTNDGIVVTAAPPPIVVGAQPFLSGTHHSATAPPQSVFEANQPKPYGDTSNMDQIPLVPMEPLPPSYEQACQR